MILIDTQKEEFSKLKDIRIFEKIDNERRFNGNLLVIGLGGLGSRVVSSLKGMLMNEITPEDNIHYLMIDSDIPSMEMMIEDSKEGNGLNATEIISIYRPNLDNLLVNGIKNNPVHPNLANWMREDFPMLNIGTDGAKGNRQIGRLMFSNAYEDVRLLLFDKLEDIYARSSGKLDIMIVSGVSGGTGSGILSDVTYNIRAFAKVKKWKNFRLGGCLLMPDVLYGNRAVAENMELMSLLNANGYATMKEIDYYMRLTSREEPYTFESTTHRLTIKENIFDSCMLISGKKDEQGYIPEGVICSDTAYFLSKLATFKYVGGNESDEERELLRDVFFNMDDRGHYKVINDSDYKIPIHQIENICECEVFEEAYKRLHAMPDIQDEIENGKKSALSELQTFLQEKAGDEIHLSVNGLIRMGQFEKPLYKAIKKNQDGLRESMGKQLKTMEEQMPVIIKSLRNKLLDSLDSQLNHYMNEYGPYAVMEVIGAAGIGGNEQDRGMIAEIQKLNMLLKSYQPTGEFSRIVESIKDIVSKRFFTFPSAKRETENGYYDACVKETLTLERTMLVDGIDGQDMFGDAIRWLRSRAERLEELYAQFNEDLKNAIEDMARDGKRVTDYLLKDAVRQQFLPSDYITEARIDEFHKGLVKLLVDNESNIDNGRVVQVKQEMEHIYKNMLISMGVYAPEKLITVAFAEERPTLQELNIMFVSPTNEKRQEIMRRAAKAFVEGASEKTKKKKLCILKPGFKVNLVNKKYISLPAIMPHFSQAVKELFIEPPYRESEDTIALNTGDVAISVDDMYVGVPLSMLACIDDMRTAYQAVNQEEYHGIHIDEVNKDMFKEYPGIA